MTVEVAFLISALSVAFSIFFGLKNNKRSDTKDIEERTKERTEINIKLQHISANTQEIKEQIASLMKDVQRHGERLTQIEGAMKHTDDYLEKLHARITSIEDRVGKLEREENE